MSALRKEEGRELDGRREPCKEHFREADRGGRRDSRKVSELEARTEGGSERICLFLCKISDEIFIEKQLRNSYNENKKQKIKRKREFYEQDY
mgnify:CR=1